MIGEPITLRVSLRKIFLAGSNLRFTVRFKSGAAAGGAAGIRQGQTLPRIAFELFLRVITVSLETMKIVSGLPKLDIAEG